MKFIKKVILVILLIVLFAGGMLVYQGYNLYTEALNKISVKDKVAELRANENYTKFEELPEFYVDAVIATEDHRFYNHGALDYIGLLRAFWTNIKTSKLKEGGSSITQQVAKNVYFTQEKTALRKIAEIFMAFEIERNCDKDTIFEMYVNTSYFGSGYYGITKAAQGYYNKKPIEMTKYESSMMAGVPNAPSIYAPNKNPELASQRQRQVLEKMARYGYITEKDINNIIEEK